MTTTSTEQAQPGFNDKLLMTLAIAAVIGGVVAYYYLEGQPTVFRFLSIVGGLAAGGLIASVSQYGKQFWKFVHGARIEWRKIVWPSRQDAIGQAIAVIVFSFLMGFFFWGLDFFLSMGVNFLRGTG